MEPLKVTAGGSSRTEIIPSNPTDSARFKRYGKRPTRRQITLLTPAEIDDTAEKLPGYYAIAPPIMAWCALRFAEVSELRVKDISDAMPGWISMFGDLPLGRWCRRRLAGQQVRRRRSGCLGPTKRRRDDP